MVWVLESGLGLEPGAGLVEAGEVPALLLLLPGSLITGRTWEDTTRASATRTLKDTKLEVNIIALKNDTDSSFFRILTQHVIAEGL